MQRSLVLGFCVFVFCRPRAQRTRDCFCSVIELPLFLSPCSESWAPSNGGSALNLLADMRFGTRDGNRARLHAILARILFLIAFSTENTRLSLLVSSVPSRIIISQYISFAFLLFDLPSSAFAFFCEHARLCYLNLTPAFCYVVQLFVGKRQPWRGILLYGPPGE